jgi:hypothetical protein
MRSLIKLCITFLRPVVRMEPSTDEMPVASVKTSLSLGPNYQILWGMGNGGIKP